MYDSTMDDHSWQNAVLRLKVVSHHADVVPVIRSFISDVGRFRHPYEEAAVQIDEVTEVCHTDVHSVAEPYTELCLQVCAKSWKESLIKLCLAFQYSCLTYGLSPHRSPLLVVSERGFFSDDCVPAQMGNPLACIQFGNLLRVGHFMSHFKRNASGTARLNDTECLEIAQAYLGKHCGCPMQVDFEHDRKIFTVCFAVQGETPYMQNRETKLTGAKTKGCMFAIRVKYDSIRRIVVDTYALNDLKSRCTRIFFLLNYPPEMKRLKDTIDGRNFFSGDRKRFILESKDSRRDKCSAINDSPMFCLEFTESLNEETLYILLSRINGRTKMPIEFSNIECSYFNVYNYLPLPVRIIGTDHRKCAREQDIRQNGQKYEPMEPKVDKVWSERLRATGFGVEYLIAALLSRGSVVKDQILINEKDRDCFLNLVVEESYTNAELTLEALERLLNFVDETKQTPPLFDTLKRILENLKKDPEILRELLSRSRDTGYTRVRKMIATPTRTLLVVPELLMGNRVLRTFDDTGDGALRVQFRDDDGTKLRKNGAGLSLIKSTVHNTLLHGVYISNRHFVYLASSNSQMRDNGCYFFDDGAGNYAQKIRESLGKFDKTNIPKLMSRMGQCFTQAEQCEASLGRNRYNKTWDFIGGKDSNGDPYTFSDGVGKMAYEFASQIAKTMDMGACVPSCFQIRYRGIKGVLSVDPAMDDRQKWAEKNGVKDSGKRTQKTINLYVLFRPSQDKFSAPRSSWLEIVKFSSPVPVCLNRPLICIMDQVSEMQGYEVHTRVCGRIHALLDRQLMQMAEMLMSEDRCRERLNELPRRISVDFLSSAKGFALTQEPFFRTLLHASAKYTLKKQLMKEQIQVPFNLGRSMFGIVDETGLLQYGQVFIQYTHSIELKTPGPHAAKTILKGRVLMTKNPSVVAGDVRVFEAVDIPELRHLVDVVVFPQTGPRPHPDEMAGSDLDGDEYSVTWDPLLFFDHNEDALDFTKDAARVPQDVPEDEVVSEMRKFFVMYIEQDSIGTISNAFLINADIYGIKSEVCKSIARKHSKSVDFPKTGAPPAPLVKSWTESEEYGQIPPEKPERSPDFMCKNHEPFYASRRLVGQLFRRIQAVENVLTLTMASEELTSIVIDESLLYPEFDSYRHIAERDFAAYGAYIISLMDNYGIEDEGQLFSGCITNLRNRLSEKDNDDMSLYNTNFMIEQKVTDLFKTFRKSFFNEFGGFEACTVASSSREFAAFETELRRICLNPTSEMKAKAAAYYYVCYDLASKTSGKRLLSFPWLVWDILAQIKLSNQSRNTGIAMTVDPLSVLVTESIDRYCAIHSARMTRFISKLTTGSSGLPSILRYCRKYAGLDKIIFVICEWASLQKLLGGRLNAYHLTLLLIQFGVGHLVAENAKMHENLIAKVDCLLPEDSEEAVDLRSMVGGIGRLFIRFLQFLSSRTFETLKYIDFSEPNLGYKSKMLRGQWLDLQKAALKSFYRLMLKGRFDELPLDDTDSVEQTGITELEPFVIEVPENIVITDVELRNKMKDYCGVDYLELRRVPDRKGRVIISAKGSLESLARLRELVTVESIANSQISDKERSDMMVRLVYERIQQFCA